MTAAEQLRQQAREQYNQEIAIKLLNKGMPDEEIKDVTGLTTSKLNLLKKAMKSEKH